MTRTKGRGAVAQAWHHRRARAGPRPRSITTISTAASPSGSAGCTALVLSIESLDLARLCGDGDGGRLGRRRQSHDRSRQAAPGERAPRACCIAPTPGTNVFDAVAANVGVPMLHIGEATADRLVADGRTRVALLGTRFTMTEPLHPQPPRSARHHACADRGRLDPRSRPDHLRGTRRRARRPRQPAQAQDPDHRARQAEGPGGRPRLHRAGARGRRPRQRAPGLRHHRDPRPRRVEWMLPRKSRRGRCGADVSGRGLSSWTRAA